MGFMHDCRGGSIEYLGTDARFVDAEFVGSGLSSRIPGKMMRESTTLLSLSELEDY
jgi:hypothetical protein